MHLLNIDILNICLKRILNYLYFKTDAVILLLSLETVSESKIITESLSLIDDFDANSDILVIENLLKLPQLFVSIYIFLKNGIKEI